MFCVKADSSATITFYYFLVMMKKLCKYLAFNTFSLLIFNQSMLEIEELPCRMDTNYTYVIIIYTPTASPQL